MRVVALELVLRLFQLQQRRRADAQELPRKFLEAILADLRRGGIVLSVRGAEGGYSLTRSPQESPDQAAYVELDFQAGVPVRANGVDMSMLELIESLEIIAGAHGVGRIDVVENRLAGIKEREVYEAPAAVVLHTAHKELEKLVIPRDLERVKHDLSRIYADLVYSGQWFSHTRQTIDAFVAAVQPRVTGSVRLKLFKGDCRIVGRKSPYANVAADMLPAAAPQVV